MRKGRRDQRLVDFMLHSRNANLAPLRVLAIPADPRKTLSPFGLPTAVRPSDHIPLAADYAFV
jgi:mRNA deadenylase 3'-5' endonuclease subunit Ccr4